MAAGRGEGAGAVSFALIGRRWDGGGGLPPAGLGGVGVAGELVQAAIGGRAVQGFGGRGLGGVQRGGVDAAVVGATLAQRVRVQFGRVRSPRPRPPPRCPRTSARHCGCWTRYWRACYCWSGWSTEPRPERERERERHANLCVANPSYYQCYLAHKFKVPGTASKLNTVHEQHTVRILLCALHWTSCICMRSGGVSVLSGRICMLSGGVCLY